MSSRILTQAEIDALLPASNAAGGAGAVGVVSYDFCRPDRVSKDQLRALHFLHERFAVNVSTSLSAYLRAATEVTIVSAEQFLYSEFLMSLPDSTAFYGLELQPLRITGALEISPVVAFTVVERMLGGSGLSPGPSRPLTEIELNVVDTVVKVVLETLTDAWRSVRDVQFRVRARETRPQMLQVTDHNEIMILLVFDVRLAENRGALHLCFPASVVEEIAAGLTPGGANVQRPVTPTEAAWLHSHLSSVPLEVAAQLETRLSARELVALQPGEVIVLPHSVNDAIDVRVGDIRRYSGRLVRQGGDRAMLMIDRVAESTLAEAA